MFTGRTERRASCRYPVKSEVFYSYDGDAGEAEHGRLLNISSGGILLESSGKFRRGMKVDLEIPWPAPDGHNSLLVVKIVGSVVRVQGKLVAVAIKASEFCPLARKIADN